VDASAEQLINHLERPLGRGHSPEDAFTGAAGGAACGDLIRVSIALDPDSPDGRIADAGFDASGCGATVAAGSAAVSLLRGACLLEAARIGAQDIVDELGGLSAAKRHAAELAADALHRALGGAARACASLSITTGRTLVAMSGGVDSAVAALLVNEAGGEAVGVTLELWSDAANDGELSCCSAQAVRGARELAHELGMAHLSIDLRAEFRAGVVDGWLADHAAGLTPNPCVRCNGNVRLDAMLELAGRLGSETLATGHYARVADPVPAADASEPLYVLETDSRSNTVTVGPRRALLARELRLRELTLHRDGASVDGVRVRAHGRTFPCRLAEDLDAGCHALAGVELEHALERTAPGQIACLYAGELIVGHGTITV
jgi:tRNA-specific 2-thiouridylase